MDKRTTNFNSKKYIAMKETVIKEMTVTECWCPHCYAGQMEQIWQEAFDEKKQFKDFVGQPRTCNKCQGEYVVGDIINVMPQVFLISSANKSGVFKANMDIKNYMESGNDDVAKPLIS